MLNTVINFFDHPFFILLGGLSAIMLLVSTVWTLWLVLKGVVPVWYRLGMALSTNKIAIFAGADEFSDLRSALVASKMFKRKNISRIGPKSIGSAESKDLFVLHWTCFKDHLDHVLKIKKDSVGLVVYAPQENGDGGRVDKASLEKMSHHRNVTLVNFRGRLLQDVFVSMITTKRAKK